jgi:FtsZ-binding cell division protein ZapB
MDKDKKIKQLEALVQELIDENTLLWDYLEELKEAEQMEVKEIEKKFMEELFKNSKNIGEA